MIRVLRLLLVFGVILATSSACELKEQNPKVPLGAKSSGGQRAVVTTDKGDIEIKFFESDAPTGFIGKLIGQGSSSVFRIRFT